MGYVVLIMQESPLDNLVRLTSGQFEVDEVIRTPHVQIYFAEAVT